MFARLLQRAPALKASVVIASIVLVLLGVLLPLMLPYRSPVTRAAYERIEDGMTQAEVEAILGGPPGDYRTRPGISMDPLVRSPSGLNEQWWRGDEGEIIVGFDAGTVRSVSFYETEPLACGPFALAWWRLKRIVERWWE
jgi:hypothetical protein